MTTEDEFTPAREDCPHPEWWHSEDSQGTEFEVSEMIFGLVRAIQPRLCVETGTYTGQTATAIADALRLNGHGELHTFEIQPDRATAASERFENDPYVYVHQAKATHWDIGRPVDFAFIDSETDVRIEEADHLTRWLSRDAVVVFHDTRFDWADVLHDSPLWRCLYLATPRGVTIAQRGLYIQRKAHDWTAS